MKIRVFYLIILTVAFMFHACEPTDSTIIAGEVIEVGSGNAVSGAIVEITAPTELQTSATTDSLGSFSFDVDVEETVQITLEISKQGYETTTTSFKISSSNNVDDLIIELSSADNQGGNNNDSDEVTGEAGGPAAITLNSISNQTINVSETGGVVNTAFTFGVQDSAGRPVGQGHEMSFEIIRGPGGGESITPETGETNSKGLVTSNLFSGDSSGTVRIEAVIERPDVGLTVRSSPVLVSIISGFPVLENFHVVPEVNNFEAFGFQSSNHTNTISASLGDSKNNPVLAGTAVYFWAEGGGNIGSSVQGVATDDRGLASVELRADGSTPTGHPDGVGFIDVYAQTVDVNNDYITKSTKILFTTRQAVISANPTSFSIANGGGEEFSYTVTDQNGYPMAAGTQILVEASPGLTLTGDVDFEVPDSFNPGPGTTEFGFSISDSNPDRDEPANDKITISVTTPSGHRSSATISGSRAKTVGN